MKKTSNKSKSSKRTSSAKQNLASLHRGKRTGLSVNQLLSHAEQLLVTRQESKIADCLTSLEKEYEMLNEGQLARFNRLYAFGLATQRRLVEAEQVCHRGLKSEPESLDYHFILSYVHLSLREFAKAEEHALKYISMRGTHEPALNELTNTGVHNSQVCNFCGSALFEQQKFAEADQWFGRAVEADEGNYLPYLNRIKVAQILGKKDEAAKIAEAGLKNCRQIQELRLVRQSLANSVTVAACLIVKNEEELLPGCLESIRDWVDEIIIVDTGSTDRTVEIAKSYGARVFIQPWEGDFSKHRNYSIDQATGEWILIIDADERFNRRDVPTLKEVLNDAKHKIVSINVFNNYRSIDHKITSVNSIRLFRRSLNLRYEGIVHNMLQVPPAAAITRCPFSLEHLGYDLTPEKMEQKFVRTKSLLEEQIRENPNNAFAWFNLAQLYRGKLLDGQAGIAEEVLNAAGRVLELTDPAKSDDKTIHLMALDQMAWTYFYLEDFAKAESFARQALALKENYLDPLMLLGHVYSRQDDLDRAEKAYEIYLEKQASFNEHTEVETLIYYHSASRVTALYGLGLIAEKKRNKQRARRLYEEALRISPAYLDAELRLGSIALEENNLEEAENCFRRQLESKQPSPLAALGLGYIYAVRQNVTKAADFYEQAVTLAPQDAHVIARAARFYHQVNKYERARELYLAANKMNQKDYSILVNLASLEFEIGDYQSAIGHYESLVAANASEKGYLNDLANCHYRLGNFERAEHYYRQAVEGGMDYSYAYRNLGMTQLKKSDLDQALSSFEKYLQITPKDAEIKYLVGDIYTQQGKFDKAILFYEQILSENPSQLGALYKLSECYLHMGHTDSALLGYRKILESDSNFEPARMRLLELTSTVT